MSSFRKIFGTVYVFAFIATAAQAQTGYTVQGIGNHSNGTYPQVINDAGDVAGYHYPNGQQRAFVYVGGVFADIGTFGGNYSWVTDLNASGVAVGYSYLAGDSLYHAFLYDGSLHDIGTFNGGGYAYAAAINTAGQVVGTADGFAFLYSGGTLTKLVDLLPAGSGWNALYNAVGINDAGQIVGHGFHSTLGYRAFLFSPASGASPASIVSFGDSNTSVQYLNAAGQAAGIQYNSGYRAFVFTPGTGGGTFTVIPSLGGTYTYPYALNDLGQLVGQSYLSNDSTLHAFLYSNGQTTDLGTMNGSSYSQAFDINNSGVIVGYSNGYFVYANGVFQPISNLVNACSWSIYEARHVNNAGQITGYGYQSSVGSRGYLMSPLSGQATLTVPSVYGSYRRDVQLQAQLTAGCSYVSGATLTFSLNGTTKGTAQTQQDGWARLQTNIGNITVGSYPGGVVADFAGSGNLTASTGSALLTVNPATPIITWNPEALVEGTPLGPNQFNATADTPGTFYYYQSAGTVFGPGLNELNGAFYPTDTTNYYATGMQAYLTVRQSNPPFSFSGVEVPGLGGTSTELTAFNNAGQAVGYSYAPGNSYYRAIRFSNGTTTDLGTLGGLYSQAADINDSGAVTGWAYTTNNNAQHAFLYSNGAMFDLDSAVHGTANGYSAGTAINAAGQVALYANASTGYYHAFLYSGGTATDLGTLSAGQYSYPTGINNSGQVVGYSYVSNCYHAFRATTSGMQDLGTLGGSCSQATGINDSGDVIGWAYDTSNQTRAFVYRNGVMTDLGTLGGSYATATAINNAGEITGWSYTTGNSAYHAFKYANGVMTDLGVINYYSQAYDLNDSGDAVGRTYSTQGYQTAFIKSTGAMLDLNALVNVGQTAGVNEARFINNPGQILARSYGNSYRWYVLTPTTLQSSSLSLAASTGVFGGTTTLTATLGIASPSGALVRFSLNGSQVGTALANAQGVAQLAGVNLGSLSAGTHTAVAGAVYSGDATYAGSTAAADVVVTQATPTITWNNPAAIVFGTLLDGSQLNAYASVGGTFAYSPAAGTQLPIGTGQSLSVTFTPYDATNYTTATKSVTIDVGKATQTITFGALGNKTVGDADFAVAASASSGLSVTLTPTGQCTLSGGVVHLTGAGACTIRAEQGGNANYDAATAVDRSFTIGKGTQAISFGSLAAHTFGDADFSVSATATSGLTVAFAAVPGGQCTVAGSTVHITGAGACTIRASQAGDTNYNAALSVDQPFAIAMGSQAITITTAPPASAGYNTTFTTAATGGGSGNAVAITTTGVCSLSSGGTGSATILMTGGTGTCVVNYNQAGNANYATATTVTRSVTAVGYQFTGFFQPIDMPIGTTPVWNTATAGQAIPAKWQLTLNGSPVSALSSYAGMYSVEVACGTGTGTLEDAIEEYAPGASAITYDGNGNFHINWKTLTTYKGKCRAFYISFSDGSNSKVAYFKFK